MHDLNERVDGFMDADQIKAVITWNLDQQLGAIRHEFKEDFFTLRTEISAIRQCFEIPGIIGDRSPFPTITDYIKHTFSSTNKQFEDMKKKMDQLEEGTLAEMRFDIRTVESSLSRLSNNSEENFKKARDRLEEEIRKVTNDIKSKLYLAINS